MRETSNLDRIYVNELNYTNVKVVASAVKSDHQAVVAYNGPRMSTYDKRQERCVFRKRSPTQHALFVEHISQMRIDLQSDADVQSNSAIMKNLLDRFYPEQQIMVSSTGPRFVTPAINAMLQRKNRLM